MLSPTSETSVPLELPDSICNALIVRASDIESLVGREKRSADHAAGRLAAAEALQQAGCLDAVGRRDNGCPIWPDGIVGSISHTRNFAWAAIGSSSAFRSIGIDTEPMCEPETIENLRDQIGGGTEWRLARNAGLDEAQAFTVLFSAKESLYKCVYPLCRVFFDFGDVCLVEIGKEKLTLRVNDDCPNRLMRGVEVDVAYSVTETDVFTACWLHQGSKS